MQDPSMPVGKNKGVLTSFITGQPMVIPEKDIVRNQFTFLKINKTASREKIIFIYLYRTGNAGRCLNLRNSTGLAKAHMA